MLPEESGFPPGSDDEKVLRLQWLSYLRGAVLRNLEGLDDAQSRWAPDGRLIPLLGRVNHLTNVEWRWIDGGFDGADVSRSEQESDPGIEVLLSEAVAAYRQRATVTGARVRSLALAQTSDPDRWAGAKTFGGWSFT